MPTIRQLSSSVINKIAAGEVIERPGSVVKELMENAIDAGARRIDVSIEKGGTESIRVVDDGCGIEPDQLTLAIAPHATSKIADADDLFRVATLGFRGEALASIAEISRMLLRSRTSDSETGSEFEVVGGKYEPPTPCGCRQGTQIEIRNLFFNTPVRRKFMKSVPTEAGHSAEAFSRIALANPNVHFTFRHNARQIHDLPAVSDPRERIARLLGQELCESLIPIETIDGEVRIWGHVANPTMSRGNTRLQYLFLNGRFIRDRALQHALGEAYRGLLLTGRFPIALLHLEMPPEAIDVNVHPTKLEVRFQDGGRIYSQLLSVLRTKFLSTDLTARGSAGPDQPATGQSATGQIFSAEDVDADPTRTRQLQTELVDWAKGRLAEVTGGRVGDKTSNFPASYSNADSTTGIPGESPAAPRRPLELNRIAHSWPSGENAPTASEDRSRRVDAAAEELTGQEAAAPPHWPSVPQPAALQIHNRYLITESEEGVVVIDQHALHERILYERLREKVLGGALETQHLLVPEPVDLSPAETAAVLEHQQLLAQLGIKVEPFGGETILVSSYPAMLANMAPAAIFREIVDQLTSGGKPPDRRDLLDDLLHMISCKAAIKAGDRLTPAEIQSLLADRHLAQDAHHCPHGRPTSLVFTRAELDRQFKRT